MIHQSWEFEKDIRLLFAEPVTIAIYSLLRATPITVAGALPLQYAKEYSRVADL